MDIWSIIIIIFVAQGVFTLSLLLLSPQRKAVIANRYLAILIVFVIWVLLEFLAIRNAFKVPVNIFYGTRYGSWLLVGPLLYYFYKSLTIEEWRFKRSAFLHLIPFIAFVCIIPLLSAQELSQRQIHYGMLAVFDYRPKTVTAFEYVYSTIFYIQFVHLAIYLIINYKIITSYTKKLKDEYSNLHRIIWLKAFTIILMVVLFLASLYLYILFQTDVYSRNLDYIYVVPMGLFMYSIGYYLSGVHWRKIEQPNQKYQASSLKDDVKSDLQKRLEQVMGIEKLYLQNELRIKGLAAKLDLSSHHVSQLINEQYGCSFFDFVNKYRIQEAKSLIQSSPEKNLLQIAFDAGFNNKTSFINAFKKFESQTPSAFKKTL